MTPSAVLGRLSRGQLRLRVLAGVVAVTFAALAGFDLAAVGIIRGYLLRQTDQNLQLALTVTRMQLPLLVPGYRQTVVSDGGKPIEGKLAGGKLAGGRAAGAVNLGTAVPVTNRVPGQFRSLLGEFDIAYLPSQGAQVTLEVGATGPVGRKLELPPSVARVAVGTGQWTVSSPGGPGQIRVAGLAVLGGKLVAATSLDSVDTTMNQVTLIVTLGSIAVVGLIGAGVFLVLRRGLRPIEAMAAQADRITAGDLTERVSPQHTRSEVGRLGTALNGMLARIEAAVREREASQEETKRFFADASHELRTPLASLRANAELYLQGALSSPDQVDEVMDRIAVETRRMGRLVDDMLRLARLGQHPDQCRVPVDVTALVAAAADRVSTADPDRTWHVEIAPGLSAMGDEELLRRAVDNLLTNVLTHTPRATAAAITAASAGGLISIEVADDGPGVPAGHLPHLFDRFYRASAAQDRPGSGLGLAIAAEVAAAHGGTATAALVTPHGLRITLTLPRND